MRGMNINMIESDTIIPELFTSYIIELITLSGF